MRSYAVLVAFVLCSIVAHVSSTLLLTTTGTALTLTGATVSTSVLGAIAAAGGLGALAVAKGALIAKHLRSKRSTSTQQDEEATSLMFEVAQQMDSAGCVPKLLCELEAMPVQQLSPSALAIKSAFSGYAKKKTGVYSIASNFGSKLAKNNPKACDLIFSACPLTRSELFSMLETSSTC